MPHPSHTKRQPKPAPDKPDGDFPLWWHQKGYWTKKIDGQTPSFGADPAEAKRRYEAYTDARKTTPAATLEKLTFTLRECVNRFFTRQFHRFETGEIDVSSLTRCRNSVFRFQKVVGGARYVSELSPGDFGRYRRTITKTVGMPAFNRDRVYILMMFDWAFQSDLITAPPRTGDEFEPVAKAVLRREKAKDVVKRGHKEFTVEQLREFLDVSSDRPTLHAMILLAVNAGLGNSDIANLTKTAIDWDNKTIRYPRAKTGIDRIVPLWDETVDALRVAIEYRPKPAAREYADRVFLTEPNLFKSAGGLPYVRKAPKLDKNGIPKSTTHIDSVNQRFKKVLKRCKLDGRGLSFNVLRATFRTLALGAQHPEAVKIIMGHQLQGMDEHYIRSFKVGLLRDVVSHVHDQVFPSSKSQ